MLALKCITVILQLEKLVSPRILGKDMLTKIDIQLLCTIKKMNNKKISPKQNIPNYDSLMK